MRFQHSTHLIPLTGLCQVPPHTSKHLAWICGLDATHLGLQYQGVLHTAHRSAVPFDQPRPAVLPHVQVPGLGLRLDTSRLDLQYHQTYRNAHELPDAYERLLLDVVQVSFWAGGPCWGGKGGWASGSSGWVG